MIYYAISEFSWFSDLVAKLRREGEATCEAALIRIGNIVPWW